MKRFYFLIALCLFGSLYSSQETQQTEEIVIYNRILAKVGDKTISVVDVMKKMDLFLQKNYPDLSDAKLPKYQFYSSQWRDFLNQMIDTELMLADAEKLEVKVTDAEVREEILNRFGPNIMPVLDTLGVTYEEARKMIHDEMIVQKMTWFRVNSKVLTSVNPKDIKQAYQEFCEQNPEMLKWQYQVLSIRSPDKAAGEALAARAAELLSANHNFAALSKELKAPDEMTTISISEDLEADERSIAATHKQVLMQMSENTFSAPIAQVSRVDNSTVYRIFYLKKLEQTKLPAFEKISEQIRDKLLQNAAGKENSQYIVRLRERLGFDEKFMMQSLPSDFQPFNLVAK